ncbi:hypothetical protein [Streptococcus dysgalactiae]|uniref:hypothetical protein n=1 Tax=Streptococcus dysgalactiae TaxID=1334 RepID=UPI003DA1B2DA
MDDWKTMLEVANDLHVAKHVVKYHRQKLTDDEVQIQDGVTYISPKGIAKIKTFLRSPDYSEEFETMVKNQLNLIQELLVTFRGSPEKNTSETIESFRKFLIHVPDSLAVLQELEKQSTGTIDSEFYFSLMDYIERKNNTLDNFFN